MKKIKFLRILKNTLLAKIGLKRSPIWVSLRLTNKCNLRCSYCDLYEKKDKEMDFKEICKIVDVIEKECAIMLLSGGEPLLRKDIDKIIEYIQKKDGIFLSMVTNGAFVKDKLESIKKLDWIALSLDGDSKTHDKNRSNGSYRSVIKAIKLLKKNKIPFSTNTVLTKNNIDYVDHVIGLSKKHKFPITFIFPIEYNKKVKGLYPPKQKLKLALEKICKYKKESGLVMNSDTVLKRYEEHNLAYSEKCFAGINFCNIDVDGKAYVCVLKLCKKEGPIHISEGFMKKFKIPKRCFCIANCYIEANLMSNLKYELIGEMLAFMKKRKTRR